MNNNSDYYIYRNIDYTCKYNGHNHIIFSLYQWKTNPIQIYTKNDYKYLNYLPLNLLGIDTHIFPKMYFNYFPYLLQYLTLYTLYNTYLNQEIPNINKLPPGLNEIKIISHYIYIDNLPPLINKLCIYGKFKTSNISFINLTELYLNFDNYVSIYNINPNFIENMQQIKIYILNIV